MVQWLPEHTRYSSVLSLSLGDDLLLVKSWLGESKGNLVSGQLVVAVLDGIDLAVHHLLVQWVQKDLGVLSALHGHSGGFSSDVGWEDL
jgi:hypothetical protein